MAKNIGNKGKKRFNIPDQNKGLHKDIEKRYKDFIDLIPLGIFEFDLKGDITYCNPFGLSMMGYTRADIENKLSVFSFIHPDELEKVSKKIRRILVGTRIEGEEYIAVRKSGNVFPVLLYAYPIKIKDMVTGVRGVAFDLSKTKKIEGQLKDLLNRYEVMLEALPDLIFRFDKSGRFIDYHSNSPGTLMLKPESFMGKNIAETALPENIRKRGLQMIQYALESGKIIVDEYEMQGPDGTGYFEARYIPISETEVLDIIRDITEKVKVERALRESEERFRQLYEHIPLGMYRTTRAGEVILANPALLNIFAIKHIDDIAGDKFGKLLEDIGYERKPFVENIEKNGEVTGYESRVLLHEGKEVHLRENARRIVDENGEVFYEGSIENISIQKKAIEALRLTQFSVDHNADAAFWMGKDANFFYVNEAACSSLGYSKEELLQMSVYDIDPVFRQEIWADHWSEMKERRAFSVESIHRTKEGKEIPVELQINYLEFDGKEFNCAFARDISNRKQNEENLRQAKDKAEEANRVKGEFISNISHEIRTPLNSIIGFSEMLSSHLTDSRFKEYAASIKSAGNSLLMLINDILDLSKIEAGRMEITKEAVDIRATISEVSQVFAVKVAGKGLDFIVDVNDGVPGQLKLDKVRIRQVLFNLIGNAVKFTSKGYIRLIVSLDGEETDPSDKVNLEISVEDSGIGIDKAYQKRIFEPFYQVGGQEHASAEGTGLGLSITKRLVEMMSGQISMHSEPGIGSSFVFSLKDVEVADDRYLVRRKESVGSGLYGKKVLLIDDSDINRRFVKDNLEELGMSVIEASDGKEGLEKAYGDMPDIILLDIMMPVMDGYEFMAKLRGDEKLSEIPTIALTALAMKEDIERIEECGIDDYLIKPFHVEELTEKMVMIFQHGGSEVHEKGPRMTNLAARNEAKYIEAVSFALTQIESECLPIWIQANELKEFNKIRVFAEAIHRIGKVHDIRFLVDYGDRMILHCDNYDIEKIDMSLAAFPDYIKKMREISKTDEPHEKGIF